MDSDAEIYEKYRGDLMGYASAIVGPDHAEDVVSTVVLRTIGRRPLAGLDDARTYLLRAVLNESRSHFRRTRHLTAAPEPTSQPVDPELLDVIAAVRRLPVRQRAAVYLFYWEDLAVDEIGAAMGVGPGTVKRYLHLARRRLKGSLR